ncbi:hypothetical protein Droror1_Dr00025255 [Drosera rotundifolia]
MRGIYCEVCDIVLRADASQLISKPRLLEPVYLVEVQAPEQALGGIYSTLNLKHGPVCYGKRGEIAVTDANLILGFVIPDYLSCNYGDCRLRIDQADRLKKLIGVYAIK